MWSSPLLLASAQVPSQAIDHAALTPLYVIAGAAIAVLLADLFVTRGRVWLLLGLSAAGSTGAAVTALLITGTGSRSSFCASAARLRSGVDVSAACSYVTNYATTAVTVALCVVAVVVLALSAPLLSKESTPVGEYCFLLLCSLLGAVALFSARDLLTLIVATEALTLPMYVLVAFGQARRGVASAATFFTVSVVSTAISLVGASLLYAVLGVVHFEQISQVLRARPASAEMGVLYAAMALVLAGFLFKLAIVPFHSWAPGSYDAAPLPVAAYLTTVSKVGGLFAVLLVVVGALGDRLAQLGPVLAVLAVLAVASMTLGNLAALRQHRVGRLLGWSSIAQLGYVLVPIGVLGVRTRGEVSQLLASSMIYLGFYLVITLVVFGALVLSRAPRDDGGALADLAGIAARSPWTCAALLFGLAGLAGLPPVLAGTFAKLAVLRSLIDAGAVWLALAVVLNAVVGLAVYGRVALACFASPAGPADQAASLPPCAGQRRGAPYVLAAAAVLAASVTTAVVGLVPAPLFDVCHRIASSLAALLM